MKNYFGRKLLVYIITFFIAVTIDWMIPRFMPGDPIAVMLDQRLPRGNPAAVERIQNYYEELFGFDKPVWEQYLGFWNKLFHGDLGISMLLFPTSVFTVIVKAVPYDVALLLPAILLSWIAGNYTGAFAARSRRLDNTLLPLGYILTATPYMWLSILLAWTFGIILKWLPFSDAYPSSMSPSFSWTFILAFLRHWILPFTSLFVVQFGGWAIGMRNMIIYELEADYSHYLEALGAPRRLIRQYAFRNAMLPQITGLALQLGTIVAGALATEIVFSYPGIGYLLLQAIQTKDYFLIQGCFLFIIVCVLVANFVIDLTYILVDPRTRIGMQGEAA